MEFILAIYDAIKASWEEVSDGSFCKAFY